MDQKSNYLNTDEELLSYQDWLYQKCKESLDEEKWPSFKGLLEKISSIPVILKAVHSIKSNKGSKTAGVDGKTIDDILQDDYHGVLSRIQDAIRNYSPQMVRRVWIPKPGKDEKRPLGIPTIIDRIIQECVRLVIEPILEAQFFKHSYGFRPMRDAHMAIARVTDVVHKTGYYWVIAGDISKFFDNVNHSKLIKQLWHMGIHDRRVLMIIRAMLKAGIMEETPVNELGTPQGGIISPLLANAYLHRFDSWVTREWEQKKTRTAYKNHKNRLEKLRLRTNLKPAYLIRYADDWILITNSRINAEKWKFRIAKYLKEELHLNLSEEKTKITNIKNTPIKFLGFEYKVVRGNARKGYISRTRPDKQRLKSKYDELRYDTKRLKRMRDDKELIHGINLLNSKIRGIIQYYQPATWVYVDLSKYGRILKHTAWKVVKRKGGQLLPADRVNNLISVHSEHKSKIPTLNKDNMHIGITDLSFCKHEPPRLKNPAEVPYTDDGRKLYRTRVDKQPLMKRADFILNNLEMSSWIANGTMTNPRYNFEYFLNRAYAYNRDGGKCRICGEPASFGFAIHHINSKLPLNQVNKVINLATVHNWCHGYIHDNQNYEHLGKRIWEKIKKFRDTVS